MQKPGGVPWPQKSRLVNLILYKLMSVPDFAMVLIQVAIRKSIPSNKIRLSKKRLPGIRPVAPDYYLRPFWGAAVALTPIFTA